MPRSVKRLDRPVARLVLEEPLQVQVVHLVVEVERGRVAGGALRLAEEQLLAAQLLLASPSSGRAGRVIVSFGAGGKSSMFCAWAMCGITLRGQLLEPLLHRPDRVAVEVGRPLLELGEVLDRPQAPLRAVDLLVEHAAQAVGVEPEPPLLRADVRAEVELAGRVAVDVAVEAGHAHAAAAGSCGRRSG